MLKGNEKIDAIAWEARKQGLTYGIFSASLSIQQKEEIYHSYEEYLEEKRRKEKERLRISGMKKQKKNKKTYNTKKRRQ